LRYKVEAIDYFRNILKWKLNSLSEECLAVTCDDVRKAMKPCVVLRASVYEFTGQ